MSGPAFTILDLPLRPGGVAAADDYLETGGGAGSGKILAVSLARKLGLLSTNSAEWDDFDRSDRFILADSTPRGLPWLVSGPGQATAAIVRGSVRTTANTYMFLNTGGPVTRFRARFSVSTLGISAAVLHVAASTDLANMLHLQIRSDGWTLDKRIGGVFTNSISAGAHRLAVSHHAVYEMGIRISGTDVYVIGMDGTETLVAVPDIAAMGVLTHVGIQSSQTSADNARFYGVAVGENVRDAATPASAADISEIRGKRGIERRTFERTLSGAAGWYRLASRVSVAGLEGLEGKIHFSATDAVGRCTHAEFVAYGVARDGVSADPMGIVKLWSWKRFGGAITQARITRNNAAPFGINIDIYKAAADDVTFDYLVSGIMGDTATLVGGVAAEPTETLSIAF